MIWIFTAFLFNADTLENKAIDIKEFQTIEQCMAAAEQVVVDKENDKERPSHLHYTASCTPKNG